MFLLLGRRLARKGLVECSPQAFATARTEAEVRSFRNAGGLDSHVSLADIHRDLAAAIHVPQGMVDKLVAEELELEGELLVPIADGVRRVHEARLRGEQIVFVSDMYVARDFLIDQLQRHDLFSSGDRVYVSNEVGKSKAGGGLWDVVLDDLGVEPSSIHHVGNDRGSDYRKARKAGLSATLVDENNLNRYEHALEEHSTSTDGLASALAGASRLARLEESTLSNDRQSIRTVAAGVVAPYVIGNVLWILEHAKAEGLEAIYFVARDGQLLHDVANQLAPKVGYRGELKYLYGSRQAWALPSMNGTYDGVIETLCPDDGDIDATLRTILHRFAFEPEHVENILAEAGFPRATFDESLDMVARRRLRNLLQRNEELRSLITAKSTDARDLMLRYLDQVGFLRSGPVGLVDLGTGATLYNALSSVLHTVDVRPPVSFYFGLRANVTDKGFGFPLTYVRNESERLGYMKTPGLLTLVEMVCTADHASVTGYREEDDVVVPTFADGGNQPVVDWGLTIVRDAVRRVAEELLIDPDLIPCRQVDLRPAILHVFELFWTSPTAAEASAWGSYPFEDGWGDDAVRHPIAEKQGPASAMRSNPHRHWWEAGAQRLSGPVSRTLQRSRSESISKIRAVKNRLAP